MASKRKTRGFPSLPDAPNTTGRPTATVHSVKYGTVADITYDTGAGYNTRRLWVLTKVWCGTTCPISGEFIEVNTKAFDPCTDDKRIGSIRLAPTWVLTQDTRGNH
jgi:hypothetical protein